MTDEVEARPLLPQRQPVPSMQPVLRVRQPPAGHTLRLWTIQRRAAWERARRRGVLRADGRFVLASFRPAYRWMRHRLAARAPSVANGADDVGGYPIWALYRPKPDLRHTAHLPRGQAGVRLEFLAPADLVLLSDFDAWHGVLNDGYMVLSEADDEAFERRHAGRTGPGQRSPACQAEVEASWQRIFDLERLADATGATGALGAESGWSVGPQVVQAVLWQGDRHINDSAIGKRRAQAW